MSLVGGVCRSCMGIIRLAYGHDRNEELRELCLCETCAYWQAAAAKQAAGTLYVTADWRAYRPSEMKGAKQTYFVANGCTMMGKLLYLDIVPERFRGRLVVNAELPPAPPAADGEEAVT